MGYIKKGSLPSLLGGCGLGSLFAYSAYTINSGQDPKLGHQLALGASVFGVGQMGYRYIKTRRFMPAGLVAALCTLSTAYHVQKVNEWS